MQVETHVPDKKAHAKLSASGSKRWLNCPASVALSVGIPPAPESAYAKEGTEAHECLEFLLKNHRSNDKEGMKAQSEFLYSTYPEKMIEHAIAAAEEIQSRVPTGATLLCETKVDLSFIGPDMFGTVDAAIIEDFGTLQVIDFKYGAGVVVDPKENPQLIYYALGIAHKYAYNFSDVKLVIIQPRAEGQAPVKEWTMSITELQDWAQIFRDGVERANDPLAGFNASPEWCRFCPAKVKCPEISERALQQAAIDFAEDDSLILPEVARELDPVHVSKTLSAIAQLETWIEAFKEHAFALAERGVKVPGFKLVDKRSTRKWVDPVKAAKEAKKLWGERAFTEPELKSPAQLEKLDPILAKGWIDKRVSNTSSGVTLVPESDKRPERNLIETDFGVDATIEYTIKVVSTSGKEGKMPTEITTVKKKKKAKVKTTKKKVKAKKKTKK